MGSFIDRWLKAWQIAAPSALSMCTAIFLQIKPVTYAPFCNLIGRVNILLHGTKIEYAFHQTLFLHAIKGLGTIAGAGLDRPAGSAQESGMITTSQNYSTHILD